MPARLDLSLEWVSLLGADTENGKHSTHQATWKFSAVFELIN